MKYYTFFKRVLTFKKYPLFRTAGFKHLLINIFLISILIALPNIITLFQSVQAASSLSGLESEVPEFEISNGEYVGETRLIDLNGNDIFFSGEVSTDEMEGQDEDILVGFVKDGIYIRDVQNTGFDYSYLGDMQNDEDLQQFIDQQSSSLYFYALVYIVFFVSLIMFFTVVLMSIGIYVLHLAASLAKRRSRFMNWFKFSTFVTVLMLIPMILIELLSGHFVWWLYILSIPFYYHYYRKLPVMKT